MTKEQIEKLGITFTEGMTDEDVIKLLASRNGELEADNRKSKGIIDKYSSEIASFKDKEKARMTDEEKKANELKDLQDQIATLKKEKSVSEKVAKYVKLGYTEDVAKKVAQGEIDGIDVSEYHAEFIKSHDEALKKQLMKDNPSPKGAGNSEKVWTKDDFKSGKISFEEMNKLKESDPNLYKSLIG